MCEMKTKKLSKKEFSSTFSPIMDDITNKPNAIINIWEYVELLDKSKYFINDYIVKKKLVEKVYRNSVNTYDQILIPTTKTNVFLVIIVSIIDKNIMGHCLLDLNKEYGINN